MIRTLPSTLSRVCADAERPTLALLAATHAAWIALTLCAPASPWWLTLALGGLVVCLHGSLQHESIHGHPTCDAGLNHLLACAPLSLWIPYAIYADSHLAHHRTAHLTHPTQDPESFYFDRARWSSLSPPQRAVHRACASLLGRVILGPVVVATGFWIDQAKALARGERRYRRVWLRHLAAVGAIAAWVELVCGFPFWQYVVLFAWPGLSLTLLRSFAEHSPAPTNDRACAVVESNALMGLLYLNNNLHAVHHDRPGLAWYRLPGHYRAHRDEVLSRNGGHLHRGYGELLRRYGLRMRAHPVHPAGT